MSTIGRQRKGPLTRPCNSRFFLTFLLARAILGFGPIASAGQEAHSAADPELVSTLEFKILWDPDWRVSSPGRYRTATEDEKGAAIEEIFKTERERELAREMFPG